jgi:hypothetical protein
MELSHALVDAVWRPKFLVEWEEGRLQKWLDPSAHLVGPLPWDLSPLNPKNRVDSLEQANNNSNAGWRIDGATVCGTRFFAVPLALLPALPPLGIFVTLPDQTTFPPALRSTLDASASVPLRSGPAIARLSVSRHICRALDYQCERDPSILGRYRRLPFGSELVFENVASDPADMRLTVVANHDFERKARRLGDLRELWSDIPADAWPVEVDLLSLRFVRQIHDTVCLVESPGRDGTVVFKSAVGSVEHMYHELRFLLTIPPHPNVMPRPLAIVTKRSAFGGKRGVVGFLLRHFAAGSLRDVLPARQRAGTLPARVKAKWCRQVVAALVHIREAAGTFYPDLRPDNVLLDEDDGNGGGGGSVVLCDFEQRGNWHEWCAPEVLFRQYAENIRAALLLSRSEDDAGYGVASSYRRLLAGYAPPAHLIETPVQAANRPWFLLPAAAQEKAVVYSVGLFIYTMFEGLSNVRRSIANQWLIDPDVEFPAVRNTPGAVMDLVKRCTDGAVEWADQERGVDKPPRVVRQGGALYPDGQLDLEFGTAATAATVLDAARAWWSAELAGAESFLQSDEWRSQEFGKGRPSLRQVLQELDRLGEGLDDTAG